MTYFLKQSQTAYPLLFLMIDSADHVSAKTGLSPTVTLSKNGGAFASPAGAVTEIANGWYQVAGNATDTGTLGPLVLHATATGADPVDVVYQVVAYDPGDAVRLGVTALPNANAAATGGLPTVDGANAVKVQSGTGANQISLSSGLVTLAGVTHTGATIPTVTTVSGNVTGSVGSLATQAKADVNAEVVDVLRTDTIPDSYSADGAQPTIAQAVLEIRQFLMERAVSSTTVTIKKPDGTTTAYTLTLDDATNPTSTTRAS